MVLVDIPSIEKALSFHLAADLDQHFPQVVQVYRSQILSFVLRRTRNELVAEDIVQETFIRAYTALRRYPEEQIRTLRLLPWLFGIAQNVYREYLREPDTLLGARSISIDGDQETKSALENMLQVPDVSSAVGELELLQEALAQVSPRYLNCLLLHSSGFGVDEIAERLFMAPSSVSSYISRGREQLRQAYYQLSNDESESRRELR